MADKKKPGQKSVGTICSVNALLTLILLDGSLTPAWEPLLDKPTDDDLGGHPQKVHEIFEDDEDFGQRALAVGSGEALVMVLEGLTGQAEVYRLADGTVILAEPPRAWWDDEDNYGENAAAVQAMFAEAIAPPARSAKKVGKVEVMSGKLVVFDVHADLAPLAKALKKKAEPRDVKPLGSRKGGVVVTLPAGTYAVRRREFERKWAEDQLLAVAYIVPESRGT
jgi:hypothetical protein